jgi:hypothetical protein
MVVMIVAVPGRRIRRPADQERGEVPIRSAAIRADRDGVTRICRLKETLGEREVCTARCAFWEPGGAALPGRCAFESLDLSSRREVAADLLAVRRELEALQEDDDERDLRALFHRPLNTDDE